MQVCPVCGEQFPPGVNYCPKDGQRLEDLPPPATDEDPLIGMLLDERYQVEHRLGQGGMGVVYAARHVVIDKSVAVKILRHEYCRDKGLVQRFIREARAASKIGHPNIVDVTDFGKLPDGHIYFVMEHLVGITLDGAIRSSQGLALARVLDLGIQISHGLAAAHDKGIVHRDLKPENIFIVNPCSTTVIDDLGGQRQDFVKLLDFGIAKFSFGNKTRITRLGSVFGTPQYMSPEQAAGEDADHRGDIYAFGCILYEMVTGEVPFTSDTFMGTLTKQMFETPLAPRQLRPDRRIPDSLETIILTMLSKDPDERYQTMREVTKALDACFRDPALTPAISPDSSVSSASTSLLSETLIDLRPGPETSLSPKDLRDIDASIDALPQEVAPLATSHRRHEATEAVAPLSQPQNAARGLVRRSGARGWIALSAVLTFGLLAVGGALWYRTRGNGERTGSEKQRGQMLSHRTPREATSLAGDKGLTVSIWIHSVPQGAEVRSSEKLIGRTPLRMPLPVGEAQAFVFHLEGYREAQRTLIPKRETRIVIVELEKKAVSRQTHQPQKKRKRKRGISLKDLRDPFGRKK